MTFWNVTIRALQPLTIAALPDRESHWETASYIPASTWRGAIAEVWKNEVGFTNQLTNEFFHNGIWRDAYSLQNIDVVSIDVVYCKVCGKKKSMLKDYLNNSVTNNCPCGGTYLRYEHSEGINVVKNQSVGIEISNSREATSYGRLYTLSHIAEGSQFFAKVKLNKEAIEKIAYKDENGESYRLECYVGKKRSSGYGKVEVLFTLDKEFSEDNLIILQRVREYTKSLSIDAKDNELYISLVNRSPMILLDEYLRPVNEIDWRIHIAKGENEVNFINQLISEQKMEKIVAWGMSSSRHGWNSAWNLPKAVDFVLKAGGLHLYRFSNLSKEEEHMLAEMLRRIQIFGIGERTNEGFGHVFVSPPLYLEQEDSVHSLINEQDNSDINENAECVNQDDLDLANSFATLCRKHIKKSQLFNILELSDEAIISELIDKNEDKYLEKRLNSRVHRGWQNVLYWEKFKKEQSIGEHLRDIVQSVIGQEKNKKSGKKIKKIIEFVIGYYVIAESEGKVGNKSE